MAKLIMLRHRVSYGVIHFRYHLTSHRCSRQARADLSTGLRQCQKTMRLEIHDIVPHPLGLVQLLWDAGGAIADRDTHFNVWLDLPSCLDHALVPFLLLPLSCL